MKKTNILTLILCLFFAELAQSQNWQIGILTGGTAYNGDIDVNLKTFAKQMRPAIGLFGRYFFTEQFAVRAQVIGGRVFADEKQYPTLPIWEERGFNFKSQIVEFGAAAELRPFSGTIQPYIYGGVSGMSFDTKTFYNEPNTVIPSEEIAKDKNSTHTKMMTVFPVGGGIEFFLGNNFSIGLDAGIRICTGDYLDGFSQLNGSKSKDTYIITGLTFTKVFDSSYNGNRRMNNKNVGCPKF